MKDDLGKVERLVRMAMQEEFLQGTRWEIGEGRVANRMRVADEVSTAILTALQAISAAQPGERVMKDDLVERLRKDIIAGAIAHVLIMDTPRQNDPRRRFTYAQMETAIRFALSTHEGLTGQGCDHAAWTITGLSKRCADCGEGLTGGEE